MNLNLPFRLIFWNRENQDLSLVFPFLWNENFNSFCIVFFLEVISRRKKMFHSNFRQVWMHLLCLQPQLNWICHKVHLIYGIILLNDLNASYSYFINWVGDKYDVKIYDHSVLDETIVVDIGFFVLTFCL